MENSLTAVSADKLWPIGRLGDGSGEGLVENPAGIRGIVVASVAVATSLVGAVEYRAERKNKKTPRKRAVQVRRAARLCLYFLENFFVFTQWGNEKRGGVLPV